MMLLLLFSLIRREQHLLLGHGLQVVLSIFVQLIVTKKSKIACGKSSLLYAYTNEKVGNIIVHNAWD